MEPCPQFCFPYRLGARMCAVLLMMGGIFSTPAAATDIGGYAVMGFPVDGAYPFAVVHVSSNVQRQADGFFRLAVRVQVNDSYDVLIEGVSLRMGDDVSSIAFAPIEENESGALILRMSGARRITEGQQLLIRFIVDGELRTVTAGLIVQKLAF